MGLLGWIVIIALSIIILVIIIKMVTSKESFSTTTRKFSKGLKDCCRRAFGLGK